MNPLYHLLARLTKKLEQQADLDVVNKLLITYFINITSILVLLGYGILTYLDMNHTVAWFLFAASFALLLILGYQYVFKQLKVTRVLLVSVIIAVIFFLLYTGGEK